MPRPAASARPPKCLGRCIHLMPLRPLGSSASGPTREGNSGGRQLRTASASTHRDTVRAAPSVCVPPCPSAPCPDARGCWSVVRRDPGRHTRALCCPYAVMSAYRALRTRAHSASTDASVLLCCTSSLYLHRSTRSEAALRGELVDTSRYGRYRLACVCAHTRAPAKTPNCVRMRAVATLLCRA